MSLVDGATKVTWRGKVVTHYGCRNCGCVNSPLKENSMRPGGEFCDRDCMAYVLEEGMQRSLCFRRPRGWLKWVEAQAETTNPTEVEI